MKYFIDIEFIEGIQTWGHPFVSLWIGPSQPPKPTIDLISIGIVCEDGREYYAISKDFNLKEAWNRWDYKKKYTNLPRDSDTNERKVFWIRENVLQSIHYELSKKETGHDISYDDWCELINQGGFYKAKRHYKTLKKLINKYGKSNQYIAQEIKDFTLIKKDKQPEFYGYFSDFDFVCFTWLFGKMIDLPKGFPMYCIDLKQMLDEKAEKIMKNWGHDGKGGHYANNIDFYLRNLKSRHNYPHQTNEHHALADAKWNKELYDFIKSL